MTIRTLIVDDEPIARKGIRSLLKSEADVEIIGEAVNGLEAVEMISSKSPHLVLLDVQMPGLDGFGVIEKIGVGMMPVVIFITAYDLHALKAFQVHAVDYLLKPVKAELFKIALERARAMLATNTSHEVTEKLLALVRALHAKQEYAERFIVKSSGRVVIVPVSDLDWLEADGDYVRLYVRGKYQLIRERISVLEQQLDPSIFIRIHRSVIVRIERMKEMKPLLNGDHIVLLNDNTQLPLSRTYRDKVMALLANV